MSLSLYGFTPFDRSGKIRWLLEELGLPFENHWLDSSKGDLEGDYLGINPMGRVPAVLMGDRPMIESGAICAYLSDQHLGKGMAPALSSPERQDYQQWMYFAASTVDTLVTRVSIIEDIPPGEVLDTKMSALLSEVTDTVDLLEQTLTKNEYLVGKFTTADICVSYHLYFCSLWPEMKAIIDGHPRVTAYMERLSQRPAALKSEVFTSYRG